MLTLRRRLLRLDAAAARLCWSLLLTVHGGDELLTSAFGREETLLDENCIDLGHRQLDVVMLTACLSFVLDPPCLPVCNASLEGSRYTREARIGGLPLVSVLFDDQILLQVDTSQRGAH